MLHWSQSHFLQALGWATLNSLWQMAFLWYAFTAISRLFKFSAKARHGAAVSALLAGFGWWLLTAVLYNGDAVPFSFVQNLVTKPAGILNVCLLSASVAYLLLLIFPALRLYKSWRFVQAIKKESAQKVALAHRLFVQRIAFHLGIAKKVKLVISSLVSSPVTVGYLKPVILLPVAVLNNLTTAQVEAILLHELSHIRRYDYVVNFIVSIVHTLLYFNPFARLFVNAIESERETCCDETVLQFGYDKVSYASALLQLEKSSGSHRSLALAAAGRHNLLTRIEKIVGMEKKRPFRIIQVIPFFFALLCLLFFNSLLLVNDAKWNKTTAYTGDAVFMPWSFEQRSGKKEIAEKQMAPQNVASAKSSPQLNIEIINQQDAPVTENTSPVAFMAENILPVGFDDVDGRLTKDEKDAVLATVETTKKVMGPLQWKEIETSLADVLNRKEKAVAKREYLSEVDHLNWQNVEQNLKANFDRLNWEAIQENMKAAMAQVQMDSIQNVYNMALTELRKVETEVKASAKIKASPLPDCSLEALSMARQTLRKNLDSLKAAKPKKIIHL